MTTKHGIDITRIAEVRTMKRTMKRLALYGTIVAAAVAGACAQDVGTVDRVQNNLVAKADLLFAADGTAREWYYRSTVVDAPFGSGYTFPGDQGPLERGTFDVQENTLFFYRTYSFTEDESQSPYMKPGERVEIPVRAACTADADCPGGRCADGVCWRYEDQGARADVDTKLACRVDRAWCGRTNARKGASVADCQAGEAFEPATGWCYTYANEDKDACGTADRPMSVDKDVPFCDCQGRYVQRRWLDDAGRSECRTLWVEKNAPLLAFPIAAHVDVLWEYNPSTGERTNVRAENTTDRLWWEREYLRVGWGENELAYLGNPLSWVAGSGMPGWYKDEASAPDEEPRLTPEKGYVDFLDDWVVEAPSVEYEGYGTLPLCLFSQSGTGGAGFFECVSEKVRVRNAFLAVDPAREAQYRPVVYNDHDMNRFGYFRTERLRWDPQYGTTYSGALRYAETFDLWQRDATGAITGVRPIVYHLSEGYPDDLVPEAVLLGKEWSKAFDATVEAVTGKTPGDWGVPQMLIVCENNAAEAAARTGDRAEIDPALCGDMEAPKHNGDLRYSFLFAVTGPNNAGLYGYGPMSADPLSGRIVTSSAYNYTAPMRLGANKALDQIELLAGVKSFAQIAGAAYIAQEARHDAAMRDTFWRPGYTPDEVEKVASNLVSPAVAAALTSSDVQKTDANFTATRLALLKALPDVEAMFISDEVKLLFSDLRLGDSAPALTAEERERYALRSWNSAAGFQNIKRRHREALDRGLDLAEFYDGAILRLASEYGKVYDEAACGDPGVTAAFDMARFDSATPCTVAALVEQLRVMFAYYEQLDPYAFEVYSIPTPLEMDAQDPRLQAAQAALKGVLDRVRAGLVEKLYKAIFWGVAIHEVGHNFGLRHNFEASTDSLNFFPQYWDLKVAKSGAKYVPACALACADPSKDACRVCDETTEQAAAGMREYQYSSVMDYHAKFNQPWLGIGLYDVAAIKYAYGDIVEVFDSEPDLKPYAQYVTADPSAYAPGNAPQPKARVEGLGKALAKLHPSEYPNLWGDPKKMYARSNRRKADVYGATCPTEGAKCGGAKVCKAFADGLRCSVSETVVPYRFGGDELVYGLPTVAMRDEGADPYEIVADAVERYENYFVFAGFWRQDETFWTSRYDAWVRGLFDSMRTQFQWFALQYRINNHDDYWQKRFGKRWEQDIHGGLPGAVAAHLSFNTLAGVFGRPIPARYGVNMLTQRYEPIDSMNTSNYTSPIVFLQEYGARGIYANWSYAGYLPVVTSAGAIYDRIAAFEMLADPETYFLGIDGEPDTRKYLVSYASMFPDQMKELYGGLMANNANKYGWCVLVHNYQTKSKLGPVGFAPREFVDLAGREPSCAKHWCAVVDEEHERLVASARADLTDPDNPACPAGYVPVEGQPLEPEPLYVFPTTRFRIPLLAAYYGMSLLVDNYDQSFMDATRLWLKGAGNAIEPPAGADIATCEDRFSGRIYQAYALPDGGYYPAYDLVKQCADTFACYDPALNGTLTDAQYQTCRAVSGAANNAAVAKLTIDDLRKNYTFHPLQFQIGKLELIRAMHEAYDGL